ncbi:hypothetical protein [uncultured Polaribacter sp.]|uniref:hypothetical protein n=1 Tax=uncultured Polaribacter sp. TaxID=174711 RepID=UPI002638EDAF|nr:hypothetical protein [uncultured Polaribacter sp.]
MKHLLKITFVIFTLIFLSCSQENEHELITESTLIDSELKKDFKDFALIISESLKDENVINYILTESSKRFDGDYDILLAKDFSKNNFAKSEKENVNLKTLLENNLNKGKLKSKNAKSKNLDTYFSELLEKYPTIQISVPNYSSSNTLRKGSSVIKPLVAYANDNEESITAFDEFGNSQKLTNDNIPTRPVIVISKSERVVALNDSEQSELSYYHRNFPCFQEMSIESRETNNDLRYYRLYRDDCGIYAGGGSGSGSGGTTNTIDRDNNSNEDNLFRVRFNSMKDKRKYESWWYGDAEVMVKVVFAKNSSGVSLFETTTKMINHGFIKTKWWGESFTKDNNVNIPIVYWETSIYGDRMKYMFYEIDDRGKTGKVETSITTKLDDNTSTTVKGSFDKKEKDLFMGDVIVNYKSKTKGEGTKFNTGSFSCWINQK